MKLHSPKFETALRHGIKQAIRSSPELRREYRAAKKLRRHYSGLPFVWFVVAFVPAFLIGSIQDITSRPATAVAIIALWGSALMTIRAQMLLNCLFASKDLHTLVLLPIAGQT